MVKKRERNSLREVRDYLRLGVKIYNKGVSPENLFARLGDNPRGSRLKPDISREPEYKTWQDGWPDSNRLVLRGYLCAVLAREDLGKSLKTYLLAPERYDIELLEDYRIQEKLVNLAKSTPLLIEELAKEKESLIKRVEDENKEDYNTAWNYDLPNISYYADTIKDRNRGLEAKLRFFERIGPHQRKEETLLKLTKKMCKKLGVNIGFKVKFVDEKRALEHYGKIRGIPAVPPAYMYFSKKRPTLVLVLERMDEEVEKGDSYEAQLFDEILHLRCLQEGWMDVDIAAFEEAKEYFDRISTTSIQELDKRFCGQIQRCVTNFLGEEMAIRLGYKDKILKERIRLLETGAEFISQHPEEFKIPHSFVPVSHALMCAFLLTLPPSYPNREETENRKLIAKAKLIIQALREDIGKRLEEMKEIISNIQSPPSEENLVDMYKRAIQIYAALA